MTFNSESDYKHLLRIRARYWVPVFKCQMCGEIVKPESMTVKDTEVESTLEQMTSASFYNDPYSDCVDIKFNDRKDNMLHNCGDDRMGVMRLIGMEFFKERSDYF